MDDDEELERLLRDFGLGGSPIGAPPDSDGELPRFDDLNELGDYGDE